MTEETIAAGEFKAKCLKMMAEVERTGQSLIITKRGTPLVKVVPYVADDEPESTFGCMENSASLVDELSLGDALLTSEPTTEPSPHIQSEPQNTYTTTSSIGKSSLLSRELIRTMRDEQSIADEEEQETVSEENNGVSDAFLHVSNETDDIQASPEQHAKTETTSQTPSSENLNTKKPLVISRTEPPTRGLPIENTPHSRNSATASENIVENTDEEEIFIPTFETDEENEHDILEFDDFLDEDDENFFVETDEDDGEDMVDMHDASPADTQGVAADETTINVYSEPFDEEENESGSYLFTVNDAELAALDQQLQVEQSHASERGEEENHALKEKLEWQFTSAWNRNNTQGEDQ